MIKHKFVTTVPDGPNTQMVRPSNWNEEHLVENNAIKREYIDFGLGGSQVNTDSLPEGAANKYHKSYTTISMVYANNDDVVALIKCRPVYLWSDLSVKTALADNPATTKVVGLVRDSVIQPGNAGMAQTSGKLVAGLSEWDSVTGDVGGLIPGAMYYLDPNTPGMLTTVEPNTPGDYIVIVGVAVSNTTLKIEIKAPVPV